MLRKSLALLVPLIVPIAARWVAAREAEILATGASLTPAQLADARRAGVAHAEKIRLRFVEEIPMPAPPFLRGLARAAGLLSPHTAGLTLRYGIYLRSRFRADRELAAHEFVHTAQYERLGSIAAFLHPYLHECLDPGYPWGPLEQEAVHRGHEIAAA